MNRTEKIVSAVVVGVLAVMLVIGFIQRSPDDRVKDVKANLLAMKIQRAQPTDILVSENGEGFMVLSRTTNSLTLLRGYKTTNTVTLDQAVGQFVRVETGFNSQRDYEQALIRFIAQYDIVTNK